MPVQRDNDFRRRLVAATAGAAFFGLGLREAVRLRDADLELARSRAGQLGTARIAADILLLLRPQFLVAALGLSAAGRGGWWLSRMLAVREIAVGTGAVAASRSAADPWPWPMTVSAIDGVEALVLFTALRRNAIDSAGGWAFVAADTGSAAALITRIAHLVGERTASQLRHTDKSCASTGDLVGAPKSDFRPSRPRTRRTRLEA
jgi:hypothetical protein